MEHGGEIEVESKPGAGTRFALSFPEPVAEAMPDPKIRRQPAGPRAEAAPAPAISTSAVSSSSVTAVSTPTGVVGQSNNIIQ